MLYCKKYYPHPNETPYLKQVPGLLHMGIAQYNISIWPIVILGCQCEHNNIQFIAKY